MKIELIPPEPVEDRYALMVTHRELLYLFYAVHQYYHNRQDAGTGKWQPPDLPQNVWTALKHFNDTH